MYVDGNIDTDNHHEALDQSQEDQDYRECLSQGPLSPESSMFVSCHTDTEEPNSA